MVKYNEDIIEDFIRENKDKFGVYHPPESHFDKFLSKLKLSVDNLVNIVPYLIKVVVITTLIFIASVLIWNNFIRKDREYISLKNKM